jgi:tRNA/rRNA methyltransferase
MLRTRFILIDTSHAGNVGAVARAMRTMGFSDLVLVNPRWPNVLKRKETIERASGALDVLQHARVVPTLDDALDGMHHLCATVMVPRDFGPPCTSPRAHFAALVQQVLQKKEQLRQSNRAQEADLPHQTSPVPAITSRSGIALLFGSERFGMANDDVYRCHVALRIPTAPDFGSLNLAAAVQVLAYEWRSAWPESTTVPGAALAPVAPTVAADAPADAQAQAGVLAHWQQALLDMGYLDPAAPRKLMPRLHRLLQRAAPTVAEVNILRGIARAAQQAAQSQGLATPAAHPRADKTSHR